MNRNDTRTASAGSVKGLSTVCAAFAFTVIAAAAPSALAQNFPITSSQRATAVQTANRGVPVADLSPNAPDVYVVKKGDTLWAISGLYLKKPWRWPELWGMNLSSIANPHLIFPGQILYLDRTEGYARLSTSRRGEPQDVRLSPRARIDSVDNSALPTLQPHLIEPFLVEPQVVDAGTLEQAPRIVATTDERVLMAAGDRAYARGNSTTPIVIAPGEPRLFGIYRNAVALKDPVSGEILGYEAQYVGKAELVRGESLTETSDGKGGVIRNIIPATVDITGSREEIRAGDRLLPASKRGFLSYVPYAPQSKVDARVVSIYGGAALANAGQNQVVAINRGERDGITRGVVLQVLTAGARLKDTTDDARDIIQLPSEKNGVAMVFRTFDRVSYALILDVRSTVRVGDHLTNPD